MLLFLGSGVSIESGLPSVLEITDRLLTETFYHDEKYNGTFYRTRHDAKGAVVPADDVRQFFCLLRDADQHYLNEIAPGFTGSRYIKVGSVFRSQTTYEDLFRLSEQVRQCGSGLTDDAAVGAFVDLIEQRAGNLLPDDNRNDRLIALYHLSGRASSLLEWLVAGSLSPTKPLGLDLIAELAKSEQYDRLDIVTLNHDTLVEQLLAEHGIRFVDGFGEPDGDIRWYDDKVYDDKNSRVRIFKLHGSIDWYKIVGVQYPAILRNPASGSYKTASGSDARVLMKKPSFLSGDSKTIAYNRGIYSDLFFRFHQLLREHRFMTMSGYGWGDVGINFRLINWLERGGRNRIFILHRKPEQLEERSLQLAEAYRAFVQKKRILTNRKWLSETSLSELSRATRQGFEVSQPGLD